MNLFNYTYQYDIIMERIGQRESVMRNIYTSPVNVS